MLIQEGIQYLGVELTLALAFPLALETDAGPRAELRDDDKPSVFSIVIFYSKNVLIFNRDRFVNLRNPNVLSGKNSYYVISIKHRTFADTKEEQDERLLQFPHYVTIITKNQKALFYKLYFSLS